MFCTLKVLNRLFSVCNLMTCLLVCLVTITRLLETNISYDFIFRKHKFVRIKRLIRLLHIERVELLFDWSVRTCKAISTLT